MNKLQKVVVRAPAKLNLALDVTGLAPNGYHEVDMLMQAVGIYERVELIRSAGYALRCPGSRVPRNDKNTATKAAAAFFYATGLLAGAEITVHKVLPTRAGLAGGSADAAAVLVGLNALYGARLPLNELCRIGLEVGSDVPFSILGGTARATGRGEKLAPLPPLSGCWFCVVMPRGAGVSTPEAYARFDEKGSPVHPNMEAAEAAVRKNDIAALLPHMQNALEHANGGTETLRLKAALREQGALAAMMTGSGAAVFGLFREEQAARAAAEALRPGAAWTAAAPPVGHGAQVLA